MRSLGRNCGSIPGGLGDSKTGGAVLSNGRKVQIHLRGQVARARTDEARYDVTKIDPVRASEMHDQSRN